MQLNTGFHLRFLALRRITPQNKKHSFATAAIAKVISVCEQSRDEATVEGAFGGGGVCRHRQENAACIGLRRWCASSELVNVIQHVTIVGRLRNHVRLGGVAAIAHGSIHFFDRPPAPADVVCIQQGGHSLRPGIGVLNRFSIPYRNVVLSPDIEISLDRRQIIGVPVKTRTMLLSQVGKMACTPDGEPHQLVPHAKMMGSSSMS